MPRFARLNSWRGYARRLQCGENIAKIIACWCGLRAFVCVNGLPLAGSFWLLSCRLQVSNRAICPLYHAREISRAIRAMRTCIAQLFLRNFGGFAVAIKRLLGKFAVVSIFPLLLTLAIRFFLFCRRELQIGIKHTFVEQVASKRFNTGTGTLRGGEAGTGGCSGPRRIGISLSLNWNTF